MLGHFSLHCRHGHICAASVSSCGDACNKIGTYLKALAASMPSRIVATSLCKALAAKDNNLPQMAERQHAQAPRASEACEIGGSTLPCRPVRSTGVLKTGPAALQCPCLQKLLRIARTKADIPIEQRGDEEVKYAEVPLPAISVSESQVRLGLGLWDVSLSENHAVGCGRVG